jgi:hypothetical protein
MRALVCLAFAIPLAIVSFPFQVGVIAWRLGVVKR